ncbi:MAG: NAD-dependent epimerase/dehydratase family protein [Candidatus Heimdallarchaeota archaeon]|nr:NAD-dependent epimerase/dehydratase family protein [Candidatus Heimdallarchaeota archaeon]
MRHVIFGANSLIGSSILRTLVSLGVQNIVACDPLGTIPKGIITNNVTIKTGDIIDPYQLMDIIEEGDIIYNTEIVDDEDANFDDADLIHHIGLINLLGVSTYKKAKRIVLYLPQCMSWKIPDNADEETDLIPNTPYQMTLVTSLEIARKYQAGKKYGWKLSNVEKMDETTENVDVEKPKPTDSKSNTPIIVSSGPKPPTSGPKPPVQSSGPALNSPSLGGPKPPAGFAIEGENKVDKPVNKGPSLGGPKPPADFQSDNENKEKQSTVEPPLNNQNKDSSPSSPQNELNDAKTPMDDLSNNIEVVEPSEKEAEGEDDFVDEERVDLIITRIARPFGPFDNSLTKDFCKSIRLERMDIIGTMEFPISFINPLDAGRAMIMLADPAVNTESKEFIINGFITTPVQLIRDLEKLNHSTTELNIESLNKINLITNVKKLLNKIKLQSYPKEAYYKKFNTPQIFDDTLAKNEFKWSPKYDRITTVKDAMNWFVNHIL